MPSLIQVNDFLQEHCEQITNTYNGTHYHCRCPICGDSKKSLTKKRFHLQYNTDKEIFWHCLNCNSSGNFYTLVSILLGITEQEAYRKYNTYNKKEIQKRLIKPTKKTVSSITSNQQNFNYILNDCISLRTKPNGFIQQQYKQLLQDFTTSRKIQEKLYIAYKGRYKNRIIVPIIEKDKLIYFQGRTINDADPKYLNPIAEKNNIILNKYNFKKDKNIIITEGIIDAFSVGEQGTTILGKNLEQSFLNHLFLYTDKNIIIAMDNDKTGIFKTLDFINKFKSSKIKYFIMPKKLNQLKDLNNVLIQSKEKNLYSFVCDHTYNPIQAKLMMIGV